MIGTQNALCSKVPSDCGLNTENVCELPCKGVITFNVITLMEINSVNK